MLLLDIRSVFGDYYVFQQDWTQAHRARDTVTMLQRETPEFIPPEMWPPNSPYLNSVDYSIWVMLQERVHRSWIHDVSWKNVESWKNDCWWSAGCCTMHTVIAAAIAQWHSRSNACVRVNGGHFEHIFWASDFLLCFVCFVDTGCPKCDRYKHVQSANIVWNVSLLCRRLTQRLTW